MELFLRVGSPSRPVSEPQPGFPSDPRTSMDLMIRIAREADLDSFARLAAAFRDDLGRSTPSQVDFRVSIAALLQDAGTEFFLALNTQKGALGYVQARYRSSAWNAALEVKLEDVFVVPDERRRGVGVQLVRFAIARAIERRLSVKDNMHRFLFSNTAVQLRRLSEGARQTGLELMLTFVGPLPLVIALALAIARVSHEIRLSSMA
jgi:GNAT superfamily N-acetyltransferase